MKLTFHTNGDNFYDYFYYVFTLNFYTTVDSCYHMPILSIWAKLESI
ncbi:MAG: hypothetical protein ACI9ES_003034 [Oceanospirillaceae bacterium]|jgi:hypothetical protein